MLKYKTALILAVLIFVCGLLMGPAILAPKSTPAAKALAQRRYVMNAAFSTMPSMTEPKRTWEGISRLRPELEMIFEGPTNGDAAKQIEEIEARISQKVNGLAILPADDKALAMTINKAIAAGIPVVTMYSDVPDSKRLSFVGAPEVQNGRAVAEKILEDFPNLIKQQTEFIVSYPRPGLAVVDERLKGVQEVLARHADKLKMVDLVSDEIDDAKATEVIRASLAQHPRAKLIIGLDSRSAIGAVTALKELGKKPGEVIVAGWDGDEDVLYAIKEGWVHVSPVLYLGPMLQVGFSLLESYSLSDLNTVQAGSKPTRVEIPVKLLTKRDVEGLLKRN